MKNTIDAFVKQFKRFKDSYSNLDDYGKNQVLNYVTSTIPKEMEKFFPRLIKIKYLHIFDARKNEQGLLEIKALPVDNKLIPYDKLNKWYVLTNLEENIKCLTPPLEESIIQVGMFAD